jgi:hypothetical protein
MTVLLLARVLLTQWQPHDPYHYQENLRHWNQQQEELHRFQDQVFQQEWRQRERQRRQREEDRGLLDRDLER